MNNLSSVLYGADVHCHAAESIQTAEMLGRAERAGVERVVLTATSPDDFALVKRVAAIFNDAMEVRTAFGLHPWQAATAPNDWFETLRRRLDERGAAAVGEIGLDFAIRRLDDAGKERQRAVFRRQLELAAVLQRPVVVHSVRAADETAALLEQVGRLPLILMHGFAEPEKIGRFAEMGAFFSFSPRQAADGNAKGYGAIRRAPDERILLESDWPSNGTEPGELGTTLEKIAAIRQVNPKTFAVQLYENQARFFEIWDKGGE